MFLANSNRSVAQLVEHRSPKPGAAGSSPATPAKKKDMNIEKKKTSPALFVRQVRQELQKVTWPQRRDTFISSAIVIVLIFLFSISVFYVWNFFGAAIPQLAAFYILAFVMIKRPRLICRG